MDLTTAGILLLDGATNGAVYALLALATVLFWAIPLFQPDVTIHWDLANVSYPVQKYFADSVHAGRLPYWTP